MTISLVEISTNAQRINVSANSPPEYSCITNPNLANIEISKVYYHSHNLFTMPVPWTKLLEGKKKVKISDVRVAMYKYVGNGDVAVYLDGFLMDDTVNLCNWGATEWLTRTTVWPHVSMGTRDTMLANGTNPGWWRASSEGLADLENIINNHFGDPSYTKLGVETYCTANTGTYYTLCQEGKWPYIQVTWQYNPSNPVIG